MGVHTKLLKLPKTPSIEGIRRMEVKDCKKVQQLLSTYLESFNLHFKFTKDEVQHFFLPRDDVIYSYVVEGYDEESGQETVTDFISYYSLPSTILNSKKHKTLNAAFSYYNVPVTVSPKELMEAALILAKNDDFDVFNALDILNNAEAFEELKFGVGSGSLYYYLYNWKLNEINAENVGIVLV